MAVATGGCTGAAEGAGVGTGDVESDGPRAEAGIIMYSEARSRDDSGPRSPDEFPSKSPAHTRGKTQVTVMHGSAGFPPTGTV